MFLFLKRKLFYLGVTEMARRILVDSEMISSGFKVNPQIKAEIRKAQARIRRAPEFMKKISETQGGKLSTAVSYNDLIRNYQRAVYINSTKEFTPSGFKRWKKSLSNDLRIGEKEIDYIFSQIDVETMDFIRNSKLRYGSNPQLDYAFESAVEIQESYKRAMSEIESIKGEIEDLRTSIF